MGEWKNVVTSRVTDIHSPSMQTLARVSGLKLSGCGMVMRTDDLCSLLVDLPTLTDIDLSRNQGLSGLPSYLDCEQYGMNEMHPDW